MKNPWSVFTLAMFAGGLLWTAPVHAEDKARQAYEGAVAELFGFTAAIPITIDWCREKRPDILQSLNDAEKKWRELNGELMAELERRLQDIINSSDEFAAATRPDVMPMIRRATTEMARKKMDEMPEEKGLTSCLLLPAMIDGPVFAIDKNYADQLAIIRAWPGAVKDSATPIPDSPRN